MKAGTPVFQVHQGRVVRVFYLARMIRAVIVDDSGDNRAYLRELLRSAHTNVHVAGEASDVAQALATIAQHPPDLLFLDVEMPGGSGFDLLAQLGSWPFEVIFTTAYARYAVQAIRFSALDYLLKPVQPDELADALRRFAAKHPDRPSRRDEQQQFLNNVRAADERAMKLTLTQGDRTYFIPPADIAYCTADDNYTELHTDDRKRFVAARTLKDYEDMLGPLGFLRVHRSALVNRAHIAHLDDGHVVLKNGARVEISRRKKEEVMRALAG